MKTVIVGMSKNLNDTMEKRAKQNSFLYRVIGLFVLYFKVVIFGKKEIYGYEYKEVGNLPLVGINHFEGYEIVNPKTNKVVYRKVKDWGYIGDGFRSYQRDRYNVVRKFFPKNAL